MHSTAVLAAVVAWRFATWGMPPEALVSAAKGEVSAVDPPRTDGDKRLLYEIKRYVIADTPFRVMFAFRPDGLWQVALSTEEAEAPAAAFDRIASELSRKYGPPATATSSRMTWNAPGTLVTFWRVRGPGGPLRLFYTRADDTAGKL